MTPTARPFSLLVKPAGADCNLRCDYCFYLSKAGLYPDLAHPRMSLTTVRALLHQFFATPQPVYAFAWQGGEPTLMGVDFFREVFAMQRSLAPAGARITNGLQTNGTLLTQQWAQLFRENDVLVGLSIDGPPEIHDSYRRLTDRDGVPLQGAAGNTHARVEKIARMLRDERVSYNALTVVGSHNQNHAVEVYNYLRSLRIRHMQFIPLVEWEPGIDGRGPSAFSVTPDGWGGFLNAIFDRWFPRDIHRVSIRHHDSILEYLIQGRYNVCTMATSCGGHIVIEHNGDMYPCDFYVESDLLLGNINDDAGVETKGCPSPPNRLASAATSERYRRFMQQKAAPDARCTACRHLALCHGDCPKLRPKVQTDGERVSALCAGWRAFYDHALPAFERLRRTIVVTQTGRPPMRTDTS